MVLRFDLINNVKGCLFIVCLLLILLLGCVCGCVVDDGDAAWRIVAEHGEDDIGDHLLQLVEEGACLVLVTLYLSQLLLPSACQLSTLEQVLVDDADEFVARRGGVERRAFAADVVSADECLDDGSTCAGPTYAVLFQGVAQLFVLHELARRLDRTEQGGVGIRLVRRGTFLRELR